MKPIWVHHTQEGYRELVRFITLRVWGDGREMTLGTTMGVVEGDEVKAVVLFHNFDRSSGVVEISAASDSKRWLTRQILWDMFSYAFHDLHCQAVVARIDPENRSLKRIFEAYGFTCHLIPRLRGRDKAECVLVLSDDAWMTNGFHKEHRQNGQGCTGADRPEGNERGNHRD